MILTDMAGDIDTLINYKECASDMCNNESVNVPTLCDINEKTDLSVDENNKNRKTDMQNHPKKLTSNISEMILTDMPEDIDALINLELCPSEIFNDNKNVFNSLTFSYGKKTNSSLDENNNNHKIDMQDQSKKLNCNVPEIIIVDTARDIDALINYEECTKICNDNENVNVLTSHDINEGIDFVDDYNNNCNTDMQNHIEISTLNISGMYETYQKYIKIYKCI
ncbi:hypothetical protein ACS0PU_013219 [Formica fusca]